MELPNLNNKKMCITRCVSRHWKYMFAPTMQDCSSLSNDRRPQKFRQMKHHAIRHETPMKNVLNFIRLQNASCFLDKYEYYAWMCNCIWFSRHQLIHIFIENTFYRSRLLFPLNLFYSFILLSIACKSLKIEMTFLLPLFR